MTETRRSTVDAGRTGCGVQGRQTEGLEGRMGSLKGIEWKNKNKAQSRKKKIANRDVPCAEGSEEGGANGGKLEKGRSELRAEKKVKRGGGAAKLPEKLTN